MAIFGNVTDIPLTDILVLGAKGLGRVSIIHHDAGDKVYDLNFFDKNLISLLVNEIPLTDVFSVTSTVAMLTQAKDADFIIERQLRNDSIQHFHFLLPVDQLLASVMATIDTLESLRCHFPNEKTVFITPGRNEIWLGDELSQFYEVCHILLAKGASGEELAHHTGMSLDHVLLNLYKLRSSGLIIPSRATTTGLTTRSSDQARSAFFKSSPAVRKAKDVPHISFDQELSESVMPEAQTVATIPSPGVVVSRSPLPPPLPAYALQTKEQTSGSSSADLRQVQIKQPERGLTEKLLGRIARLCRMQPVV